MSSGFRGGATMPSTPGGDVSVMQQMQQMQQQQMQAAAMNAANPTSNPNLSFTNNFFPQLHSLVLSLSPTSTQQEITELRDFASRFAPLGRLVLVKFLLEAIDFYDPALSIFSNTPLSPQQKDYSRIQLLIYELRDFMPNELAKLIFTRFEQLPVLPDAFLASFSKITNLPYSTQLVLLMMLAKSREPRWSRDAFCFLAYILHPDHVHKLVEHKVPDTILTDLIQFVATCPLAYLRVIHKRRYLLTLKTQFPVMFSNPKLVEYLSDMPVTDVYTPRPAAIPNLPVLTSSQPHRTNNYRFADLVWDAGYAAFDSVEKIRVATQCFRHTLTEIDAALTLCVLIRTANALNGSMLASGKSPIHYNPIVDACAAAPLSSLMVHGERGGGTNSIRILPSSSFVPTAGAPQHAWNLRAWVQVWASQRLDFFTILRLLDQPEFHIPDQYSLDLLLDFWASAAAATNIPLRFPVEVFLGLWSNRHGQLSALKRLILLPANKVDFTAMPHAKLLRPIEDLHWVPPATKGPVSAVKLGSNPSQAANQLLHQQTFHPWYSFNLIESLLSLVDIEHELGYECARLPPTISTSALVTPNTPLSLLRKDTPSPLFARALQQCPEVLVCALVAIKHHLPDIREEDVNDGIGQKLADTLQQHNLSLTPGGYFALDDLLDTLISIFVSPHPLHTNARPVISRLWQEAPRLVATHLLKLYLSDRAMLARVLDIVQDLKDALGLVLEIKAFPFCIDLAALAAKRQFLNLEVWLSTRLRDIGMSFFVSCLEYLKGSTANPDNLIVAGTHPAPAKPPARKPGYNPLTLETAAVFYRVLSTIDLNTLPHKDATPVPITELNGELHRTFAHACALHPKLKQIFSGRPVEVNREQVERDVEQMCATLLSGSYTDEHLLATLKQQYSNSDPYQAAVYLALLNCIIDEAVFVGDFPDAQRHNMGRLYAYVIKEELAAPYYVGRMLAVVLDALSSTNDAQYSFGMAVLQLIRERLTTWPAYCARVSQISNVIARHKPLVTALEGVCRDAAEKHPEFDRNRTEFGLDPELLAGLNRTRDPQKKDDKVVETQSPPSAIMNKLSLLVNNITTNNAATKAAELNDLIDSQHYRYFAQYITKRACTETNQVPRYAEVVFQMKQPALEEAILDATYSSIHALLDSDKVVPAERLTIKNLGTWLGLFTLARDRPIRANKLDLKEALFMAHDRGQFHYVLPLTVRVLLETASKSKVFKLPNPWLHSLLSVLNELKKHNELPSNLTFEIDDLFDKLKIQPEKLQPCDALIRHDLRPRYNKYTIIPTTTIQTLASQPNAALANALRAIAQVDSHELLVPAASVTVPKCRLFNLYPSLRRLVLVCLELTVRDLLHTLRDKFLAAVTQSARELAAQETTKDDSDENRMRRTINELVTRVTQQFMGLLSTEVIRKCFATHVGRFLDGLGVEPQVVDECVHLSSNANTKIVLLVFERALGEQAAHTLTDVLTNARRLTPKGRDLPSLHAFAQHYQSLAAPVQQTLDRLAHTLGQLHQAITQVPNHKSTSLSHILQIPDHPVCVLMSQTVPACLKQCMALPNVPTELTFRFLAHNIALKLLELESKGSLLHLETYKALLWNISKGLPSLPRELALRLFQQQLATDSDRLALLSTLCPFLLKDGLLLATDVDEFINYVFYQLLSSNSIITNNINPPRPDVRLECWIALVMAIVLPAKTDDVNIPQLPMVPISQMPRTADALAQAIQAVTIPPHVSSTAPQAFLHLSHQLASTLTRILDDAKTHHVGLVPPQQADISDLGAVGDNLSPANLAAAITAECGQRNAPQSNLAQTHEALLNAVEKRERALSALDSSLGEAPIPDLAAPVAQAVLAEWTTAHIVDRSEAAYNHFASSLWHKAIWGSRHQLQAFMHSLVVLTISLLITPRTAVSPPTLPSHLPPEQVCEAVTSLILFIVTHVDTPLGGLDGGRGDMLYTGAGLYPVSSADVAHQEPPMPKPAHVEQRVSILREYCLCIADNVRIGHALNRHAITTQLAASNANLSVFPSSAYGYLLTSLITALAVPNTPPPVGTLVSAPPNTRVPFIDLGDVDVALVLHDTARLLSPVRVPAFVFSFIDIVAHRSLMPRLLATHNRFPILVRYFIHLVIDLLSFLHPYVKAVGPNPSPSMPDSIRLVYKATLRVFVALFQDFPDVLAESSFLFCDRKILPDSCMQLRNLILAAHPRHIHLPTPFLPASRLESLPEMVQTPRLVLDPTAPLMSPYLKSLIADPLEQYVQHLATSGNVTTAFPAQLLESMQAHSVLRASQPKLTEEQLQAKAQTLISQCGCKVDSHILLAVIMTLANGAIPKVLHLLQQSKQQSQVPMTSVQALAHGNPHVEATVRLIEAVDSDTRHLILLLIANQLRYPSSHTLYFSALVQYTYLVQLQRGNNAVCEHIIRVLLERLMVHSPFPWGLLVTFIELLKNPRFDLWKQPFTHCHPHIEELFKSVAKSCLGPNTFQQHPPTTTTTQ